MFTLKKPIFLRTDAQRTQVRIRLHPGIRDFLADQENGRYAQAAQNVLEAWFYQTASTKQLQTYIKPYEPHFDNLLSTIKGNKT